MRRALLALICAPLVAAGEPPVEDAAPAPPPAHELPEEDDGGRIVGGEDVPNGSNRWQVELYSTASYPPDVMAKDRSLVDGHPDKKYYDRIKPWERDHRCGGQLIAEDWVLTAAHCIGKKSVLPVLQYRRVRVGTINLTRGGTTFRIERAVVHRGYDAKTHANDIALLHIVRDGGTMPIDPALYTTIRLNGSRPGDRPLAVNDEVTVTGWGKTKIQDGGGRSLARDGEINRGSPILQVVSLKILPKTACAAVPEYRGVDPKTTICAGARVEGKDSCTGDSGGPLTRAGVGGERVLVGLVSWGIGCGLRGVPGIYTDVSAYADWIAQAMRTAPPGRLSRG